MLGLCMIIALLILLFSSQTMAAARLAVQVFVHSVMPALFPMMVLGGLMGTKMQATQQRTNKIVFQIAFGFFAGSPASARQLEALAQRQYISKREYRALLCMSGVMSPMFFTGTLASKTGSRAAWVMLLCHWAGALLTGALFWVFSYKSRSSALASKQSGASVPIAPGRTDPSILSALPLAVSNAASAQLSILGVMIVFSMLVTVFQSVLSHLFPIWTEQNALLLSIGWAMMEIGGGMMALLDSVPMVPSWLICALCSFGGLSIWMQNLLFLKQEIHPAELLGYRMLHGVLAGILCYGLSPWLSKAGGVKEVTALTMASALSAAPDRLPFWLAVFWLIILACYQRLPRQRA